MRQERRERDHVEMEVEMEVMISRGFSLVHLLTALIGKYGSKYSVASWGRCENPFSSPLDS